jgi:hypothetical protein
MGKTSFGGPVYGAKSLLWMAHADNLLITSTVTETLQAIRVPAYEDWYVTEFKVYRGSSHSTAVTTTYQLLDDSSVVANLVQASGAASSGAAVLFSTTPTPTPGEYEGVQVAANSTLSFTYNHGGSSAAVDSNVTAWVYGYIRYLDSTRAV